MRHLCPSLAPHKKVFCLLDTLQCGGSPLHFSEGQCCKTMKSCKQNPNQSLCLAMISTQEILPAKYRGLKLSEVCRSVYLAWLMLFCLLKCHCLRPRRGGRDAFCKIYWIFLKPPSKENAISQHETVISPTHMLCCSLQTTFYMPRVYKCDLLISLAIFHNLCCPSALAACISFSDTLSLLPKSWWKIIQGTESDLRHSVFHLLCFPDQAMRCQDDTAEEKLQPARCEIKSLIERNWNG